MNYKNLYDDLKPAIAKLNADKHPNVNIFHNTYDYRKYYKYEIQLNQNIVFNEEVYDFDLPDQNAYDIIRDKLIKTTEEVLKFSEEANKIFSNFKHSLNLKFENINIKSYELGKYQYNNVSLFSSYVKLLDNRNCPRWILLFLNKKTKKIDFEKTKFEHDKNIAKHRKDLQPEPPNVRYIIDFEQAKNYLLLLEDIISNEILSLPFNNKLVKESASIECVFFAKFHKKEELTSQWYQKNSFQTWEQNTLSRIQSDGVYLSINANEINDKDKDFFFCFKFTNNSLYEDRYFVQSVDTKEISPVCHLTTLSSYNASYKFEPAFSADKNQRYGRIVLRNNPKKKAFKEQIIIDKIQQFFDSNVINNTSK